MTTLCIDIETCPALHLDPATYPCKLPPDPVMGKVPSNIKKAETIERRRLDLVAKYAADCAGHVAACDEARATAYQKTSLHPLKGRVLCIGWAFDDEAPQSLYADYWDGCDHDAIEEVLIMGFARIVRDHGKPKVRPPSPRSDRLRCGDTVKHTPSGEVWTVAYADYESGRLAAAGWPATTVPIDECVTVERCGDALHLSEVAVWDNGGGGIRRDIVRRLYMQPQAPQVLTYPEDVLWLGHNAGFDLTFLRLRAEKYGVRSLLTDMPWTRREGWSRIHCTYEHTQSQMKWSGARMDDVAQYLGESGKVGGIDGSQVYQAWLDGRHEEIQRYCEGDVVAARAIAWKQGVL